MAIWLKQSTAAVVPFGPFVDKTDGVTLETGLVSSLDHASTGIKLSKNGGAYAVRHATVTATTYDSYGMYLVTLDTTDTATLGRLSMVFSEAGTCLPVWLEFMIAPANVWDSMFGADYLQVDNAQWLGQTIAAVDTNGYPKVTIKDGTGTGELDTASGRVLADVTYWNGAAVATPDTAGYPKITVKTGTGTGEVSMTSGVVNANMAQLGANATVVAALKTMLDGTGGNVLSLKQLNIVATSNDSAIVATGSGTGSGILATGGATGHGIYGLGGATSGHGIKAESQGSSSSGLYAVGDTNGAGISAIGGDGNGRGFSTSGSGTGAGIFSTSTGTGAGMELESGGSGPGLSLTSDSGYDLLLASGTTSGLKVNSFTDDAITAASIATNAFGGDALAGDFVDEILDEVVEGSTTLRQAIRLLLSAAVGKASGGGSTTVVFRDLADTKDRITATVDANGNRTAVTRDAS